MKSLINLIKNQWTYHTKTKKQISNQEPRAKVNEVEHEIKELQ